MRKVILSNKQTQTVIYNFYLTIMVLLGINTIITNFIYTDSLDLLIRLIIYIKVCPKYLNMSLPCLGDNQIF